MTDEELQNLGYVKEDNGGFRFVAGTPSPKKRHKQALIGNMNSTELFCYEKFLTPLFLAGDIRHIHRVTEPIVLQLAPKITYTPDFFCIRRVPSENDFWGWWIEVKAANTKTHWKGDKEDDRLKVKLLKHLIPTDVVSFVWIDTKTGDIEEKMV